MYMDKLQIDQISSIMNAQAIFKLFLQEHTRLSKKIKYLVSFLSIQANPSTIIIDQFTNLSDPIEILKVLILIDNLLYYCPTTLESEPMIQFLSELTPKTKDIFQKLIHNNVIQPYSLYLQKKLYHEMMQLSTPQQQFYQNLNLLQRSVGFIEIIYTFGRYYPNKYAFAIDLNIIIAKDVKKIYEKLIHSFVKMGRNSQMLYQIQRVHEKMYIVYYNCYYYKYVRNHVPTWIKTDYQNLSKSVLIETPKKLNKSTTSTANSPSEKMSQSLVLSQKHEVSKLDESQLDLIKSLERIVGLQ